MSGEIKHFDPADLMQGIKDRIKAEFVSLIPEDQWTAMIKKQVDDFFLPKEVGYVQRTRTSDFEELVTVEIRQEAKKRLALYLSSPEFTTTYNEYGQPIASAKVKEMFIDGAGLMLQSMFGGMINSYLSGFRDELNRRTY